MIRGSLEKCLVYRYQITRHERTGNQKEEKCKEWSAKKAREKGTKITGKCKFM